jgi:hypothetical protein
MILSGAASASAYFSMVYVTRPLPSHARGRAGVGGPKVKTSSVVGKRGV